MRKYMRILQESFIGRVDSKAHGNSDVSIEVSRSVMPVIAKLVFYTCFRDSKCEFQLNNSLLFNPNSAVSVIANTNLFRLLA